MGYEAVLDKVVELAQPIPGEIILDLGIGTGNLAIRFDTMGCEIWGTDFSDAMLEKARLKLPQAHLFQADLRKTWPAALNRRFDCIVSAYVFHHFEIDAKVEIIDNLIRHQLEQDGCLVIADIAFINQAALETVKQTVGNEWEDEFYWLADEIISAFAAAGFQTEFHQVSSCGGVFKIGK